MRLCIWRCCVLVCVCVQCSNQPGKDSPCVQRYCPFGVYLFFVGALRLSTWLWIVWCVWALLWPIRLSCVLFFLRVIYVVCLALLFCIVCALRWCISFWCCLFCLRCSGPLCVGVCINFVCARCVGLVERVGVIWKQTKHVSDVVQIVEDLCVVCMMLLSVQLFLILVCRCDVWTMLWHICAWCFHCLGNVMVQLCLICGTSVLYIWAMLLPSACAIIWSRMFVFDFACARSGPCRVAEGCRCACSVVSVLLL